MRTVFLQRSRLFSVFAVAVLLCLSGCGGGPRRFAGRRKMPAESAGPFVVPPPTAAAERFYVCEGGDLSGRLKALPVVSAERVVVVPAWDEKGRPTGGWWSKWTRDEWLFARRSGRPVVLFFPGKHALKGWAEKHFRAEGIPTLTLGKPRRNEAGRRFDAGGDILASPPVPGRFPRGLLLVGRELQAELKKFFSARQVQADRRGRLLELDTSWLKVGHVDEVVAFVPADGVPGFRLVVPDPEAGLRLLSSVPSGRALFYAAGAAEETGVVRRAAARFLEGTAPRVEKNKAAEAAGAAGAGGAGGSATAAPKRSGGKRGAVARRAYLRIFAGKGRGQTALVSRTGKHRFVVEKVWDLRGRSFTAALRAAREGRCETMPIWFEVPDAGSRYLVVDDSRMWLDGSGELFPAVVAAGELRADPILKACAAACGKRLFGRDGIITVVRRTLGLSRKDMLRLPVLFSGSKNGEAVAALTPNPVNLVNVRGGVIFLVPCGPRRKAGRDETDVFQRRWSRLFEAGGLRSYPLDGWDDLHRDWGGAHCGINVLRGNGRR